MGTEGHTVEAATLHPQRRATSSAPGSGHIGVNYMSLYNSYDTPATTLQTDFAKFKNDGINTIAVTLYWYRIESSRGVYNQQFINNVIRVSNVAANYGIEVMIDFHTLVGDGDSWSNPQYVGVAMNLMTNPDIANAYVAMVSWTVGQLKTVPNIWAYAVLNEPWYWPLTDSSKNNWINLTVNLSKAVKTIDNKPVTVRFVAPLFERDWAWDTRLIGALDFISLNAYISPDAQNAIYWRTFDAYQSAINDITDKAAAMGKQVQITEFGCSNPDDAQQADTYRAYTDIFKVTSNLIGWLSWGWDRGYDQNNQTWTAIGSYSILVQATGVARSAYLVLAQNR